MSQVGPIPWNGGWVSDADFWMPLENGRLLTSSCFTAWGAGAKTSDGFTALIAQIPNLSPIRGFFYWQDPAQEGTVATDIIIAVAGSKVYTAVPTSSTWTDRTGAASIALTYPYMFDVLNGKVILANADNSAFKAPFKITAFNTNIAALGGSPPTAQIVKVVNNFAFLALNPGSASTLSRVYWSNVADPETWPAASFIDVRLNDGDIITGLSSIGTDLIIFKTNSIHRLSTITTSIAGAVTLGPLTTISDRHGAVGPYAIDTLSDGSIVFLSGDCHVYKTDGTTFVDLSHTPYPTSNISTALTPLNETSLPFIAPFSNAHLKVDSQFHRLFLQAAPFSGTAFKFYVFDYQYQAWGDWTNINSGTDYSVYLGILPNLINAGSNNFGSTRASFCIGTNSGFIYRFTPFVNQTQVIDQSVSLTCTLETTVQLQGSSRNFLPRSLIIPIRQPVNTNSGRIQVFIGWDGTYQSSAAADVNLSGNNNLITVPCNLTSASTVGLTPRTMQIKVNLIANVVMGIAIVEPFYLSEEILT